MDPVKENFIYSDITHKIIEAAIDVHNTLGHGFLESVYQEALALEFKNRNLTFLPQVMINISYKGQVLKKSFTADFLVAGVITVEIKAAEKLTTLDSAQVINYLKATQKELGLLINFGGKSLEWNRVIFTGKSNMNLGG